MVTTTRSEQGSAPRGAAGPRSWAAAAWLLLLAGLLPASDLPRYLTSPDDSYGWSRAAALPAEGASVQVLHLCSQTWQGIPWQHWLTVIRPDELRHPETALLVISGGRVSRRPPERLGPEELVLVDAARRTGSVIALLGQVPNQPLFDGLREDALIAYTFQQFLESGDESWPCLLPMTRSAMRAMDAVQELGREEGQEIRRFMVTGASKRGWTTWLVGAADPRVCAIAPMVIDVLNFGPQMKHQVECFGDYSEQIGDYSARDLPQRLGEPEARGLVTLVDPYVYRDRLTVPKLILLGTNDPYWPVDALQLYWSGLPGEKHVHYVPNAGHGLGFSAVEAITSFYDLVVREQRRPRYRWETERRDGQVTVTVTAQDPPEAVEVWMAASRDRDFRDDRWRSAPVAEEGGRWTVTVPGPEAAYVAFYVALVYPGGVGYRFRLCTPVEVLGGPRYF